MKPTKETASIFQWRTQSLTCLTFLCTACSTYNSSQEQTFSTPQSSVLSREQSTSFEQKEDLFAYLDSIMRDVIEHKDDPSIEITRMPKNDCIMLTFKNSPGNPPYSVHSRRLLQEDPNAFLPQPLEQTLYNAIRSKNVNISFSVALFPHEFLPGERITWRLSGSDGTIFKEATFCPRPMILKDKSGKIILEAALLSIHDSLFSYLLHFPAQNEVVEFISTSGEEIIKELLPLNHSVNMNYLPAVKGIKGGVGQIEIRFLKDDSSYKMEFPWGTALLDSSTGSKAH